MTAIEGVVQLDRSGEPPRIMLDTNPVQRLDVPWRDIVGCWLMRVQVDPIAKRQSVTFEMIVVMHRGPFIRLPGEDAFWPAGEMYGLALESYAAVAQREQRKATHQLKLTLSAPTHAVNAHSMKIPQRRRKGHR